jgi:hypothetical protein
MALINTLMRLKDLRRVVKFEMIEREKARVELANGKLLVVYMSDDYVIGAASVMGAVATEPHPDYIVYNHWNKVTDDAFEEAKRLKIPLVKYGKFRYDLDDMLAVPN